MDTILVVNAGSSSVKFQIFTVEGEGRLQRQIKGQMDGIGSRPRLRANGPTGDPLADRAYPIEAVADVPAAMAVAGAWLRDELKINPIAVGHRVVHGGPDHGRPVLIDHAVVTGLDPTVLTNQNRVQIAVSGVTMPILSISALPNNQFQIQFLVTQSFAGATVPLMVWVDGSSSQPVSITVR